LKRWPSALDFL